MTFRLRGPLKKHRRNKRYEGRMHSVETNSRRKNKRGYGFMILWAALVLSLLQLTRAERCGAGAGIQKCQSGFCCSAAGFCGNSDVHCGNGCQLLYGKCGEGVPSGDVFGGCNATKPCAQRGFCCSEFDFCGRGSDYCGDGCKSGPCTRRGLGTGAIIGIAFGSAFAVFLALLLCVLRIRRSRTAKLTSHQQANGARGGAVSARAKGADEDELSIPSAIDKSIATGKVMGMRYSYDLLNDVTNGFVKELGRGAFGVVYKGILSDGSEVAVKKLIDSQQGIKDFESEIRTLGSINHTNLVALRGFCIKRNHPLLVYEYVPNGSLDKWIFSRDKLLPWQTRVNIARGTTKGLSYLHEELQIGQAIIHLDIKPENILLSSEFVPKVADFGMAKLIGQTRTQTIASGGTFGYMAPEVYTGTATTKMDVYSFGVVLLELVAGRRHLDHSLPDDRLYLPAWATRKVLVGAEVDVVDPRLNGVFDALQAKEFITVALLCLQRDPDSRPDMGAVFRMVEGLKVPRQLPHSLLQELEMTERLVRRPAQALGLKADADSFFIDFGSDRSYRRVEDEESTSTNYSSSTGSVAPTLSNTLLLC